MIICGYISYPNIKNAGNSEFHSKWGSLFSEFKNDRGLLSTQFYTIFTMRRLAYIFSQVYLNAHLYIQSFINAITSLLQLIYILCFLPYKDSLIMISSILGEICTTIVIIISIIFISQPSLEMQASLSIVIVIFILISMVGQSFISFIIGIKGITKIWNKIQRWNAKSFLKNTSKVHADCIPDNAIYQTDQEFCIDIPDNAI